MSIYLNLFIYHVETAGTLALLIPQEELHTIKRLKVTGYLNGDDLRLLRDMAGKDDDSDTDGQLEELDLSEAHIVSGGGSYIYQTINTDDDVLGDRLFMACGRLKSILLPQDIKRIGHLAFSGTMIKRVHIPEGVEELGHATFYGCSALTRLSIPHTVKEMGSSVFAGCPRLNTLSIPSGMDYLPVDFISGAGIKSLSVPEGIRDIKKGAFALCCNLETVSLPSTVEVIGKGVFDMCFSMKELHIKAPQAPAVNDHTFVEEDVNNTTFNYSTCRLYVPQGSDYRSHEVWNRFGTIIEE